MATDAFFMQRALELAQHAAQQGEVPVGAVLVKDDEIIAEGWNQPIAGNDPTAHAEIVTLREAATRLGNYRLLDTTLYVTLEPCIMCIGAIIHARVKRVVYGASDPKAGAVCSVYHVPEDRRLNHHVEVTGGVMATECGEILSRFFRERR